MKPFVQRRLPGSALAVEHRLGDGGSFPEPMRHAHIRYLVGWAKQGGNVELGTVGIPSGMEPLSIIPLVRESFRCCARCGRKPKPRSIKRKRDRIDWKVQKQSYARVTSGSWSSALWCRACWRDTLKWCPELDPHSPLYAGKRQRLAGGLDANGNVNEMLKEPEGGEFATVESMLALIGGKRDKSVKATIAGVPAEGKYGLQVPLKVGKETVIRSLKPNSKSYRSLFKEFGPDESKWNGRAVKVTVSTMTEGEFKGQDTLLIEPA